VDQNCAGKKWRDRFSGLLPGKNSGEEITGGAEECRQQSKIDLPRVIAGMTLQHRSSHGAAAECTGKVGRNLGTRSGIDYLQPAAQISRPDLLMDNRQSLPWSPLAVFVGVDRD